LPDLPVPPNSRKLDTLLDDGTGRPRAELKPLAGYLRVEMNPGLVENWLNMKATRALLADLATGRLAISHDTLAARGDRLRTAYMRDLLVASGGFTAITTKTGAVKITQFP
jgi:hypothetical protein